MSDNDQLLDSNVSRRAVLQLGAGAALAPVAGAFAAGSPVRATDVDLSTPEKRLRARVKLLGSTAEEDVYINLQGTLWGIVPGREAVPICGFQGLARSFWSPNEDGSFTQRAFDIGYFSDHETKEPVDSLENPLTGETVEPFHFRYGGASQQHTVESVEEPGDHNWAKMGDRLWFSERRTGSFPSPLSTEEWPREAPADDTFYLGSETTYITTPEQLADDSIAAADVTVFWSSILSWEPWLLMDGAPGFVMWRGIAAKLASPNEAPAPLLSYIDRMQPNYLDDALPWEGRASTYRSFTEQRKPKPKI